MEQICEISSDSEDTIILSQNEIDNNFEIESVISKYTSLEEKKQDSAEIAFRNFDKYNILDDDFSDDDLIPAGSLSQRINKQQVRDISPDFDSVSSGNDVLKALAIKYNKVEKSNLEPKLPENRLSETTRKKLEAHEARLKKIREKEQKKEELQRERILKKAASDSYKNLKPGECMKFIAVFIDQQIANEEYGPDIINTLQSEAENREHRFQITGNGATQKNKFRDLPCVTKKDINYALTELQLLTSTSFRIAESVEDLTLAVYQFTKSIAQKPHKILRQEKQQQINWYAQGDNKDCVKIDKNGNGLQRLWKQTLSTFPLANLEHAEAIMAQYPTQRSLVEAYGRCSSRKEAELLLKDIATRRNVGPLSHGRNIGPELSKKIYNYLNSIDGDSIL